MIPYAYEALFNQDSVDKQLTITDNDTIDLGNADIYNESFELEEHLMNGEDIEIGSCYSGIVKFTTSCLSVLKDMVLDFSMVLNNHTTDPFTIGQYKVYSDKYTADRTKKDVVCYDALYEVLNANVMDWYDTILPDLETTVTLKQFRDSFFLHFGITQETITLDNDTMTVEKTVGGSTLSGALVLKAICASNGCFGRINRQGNFEYFYLSNSVSPTHLADGGKYITAEWEDYDVSVINKLIIRADEEDVGVTIGTGNNVYIMQDNFLLLGKSSADLAVIGQNIYNRICNIAYKPCEIEVKGNLCFEIGDEVSFEPNNGSRFSTFILNRVYKGIQAQRDTYTQEGNEIRDSHVNSLDDELKRLRGKTNSLTRTVEETVSELADFEADVASEFRQTASEISAKVDQVNGESGDSMSWEMISTKFDIKCNGNSVLKVTSAGAEINGEIKATSGFIGSDTTNGFNITNNAIYNGLSNIGGFYNDGIYISATEGIAMRGQRMQFRIVQTNNFDNQFTILNYYDPATDGIEWESYIGKDILVLEKRDRKVGQTQSVLRSIIINCRDTSPTIEVKEQNLSPIPVTQISPCYVRVRKYNNQDTIISDSSITTNVPVIINASYASGNFDEGIRINAGKSGWSTLVLGGEASSTTGTSDCQFWIGTNRDYASYKRKLYIAHAGSTASETYFEADSASRVSPALHLGWSGSVANGNAYAVSGGVVYNAISGCIKQAGGLWSGAGTNINSLNDLVHLLNNSSGERGFIVTCKINTNIGIGVTGWQRIIAYAQNGSNNGTYDLGLFCLILPAGSSELIRYAIINGKTDNNYYVSGTGIIQSSGYCPTFTTETKTFNVSIGGNADAVYYPDITKSGWTPLGIVSLYTGFTWFSALRWGIQSSTQARVDLHNFYSGTASGTASVTVLYYK